jgi:hypothetical protein
MAAGEAGEKAFKYSSFPLVGPAWNCNRLDFMDNGLGPFSVVFSLSALYLCPFMAIFYPSYQCHNFEYLNRFVQNWYYVNANFKPWEYFWHATLSFSTVLPAVLGTREWLIGASWLQKAFKNFFPLYFIHSKILAGFVLVLSGIGLSGIGRFPNYLFPLLWVSPLLIIVSFQILTGESHIFSATLQGDWRPVVSSALAALFCGWFWEMWNFYSLARWEYSVPFVNRYKIFEMPVLGYAGYLPFGLECAAIGGILEKLLQKHFKKSDD